MDEIHEAFHLAKKEGMTVTLRGAGRSYNDAALNSLGIVLDLQGMNKILEWNPETGVVTTEPGVTLAKLWQVVLPDGWWPPVVSGTMTTTLGGCLGMNIHGKNNFKKGTIGEHVLEFTALLPTGAQITCSPKKNGDLFPCHDRRDGHAGCVHVDHASDEENAFGAAAGPRVSGAQPRGAPESPAGRRTAA